MRLSSIIFVAAITHSSVAQVCESGIYLDELLPLYAYGPARSFCSSRYPASTVTVNKPRALEHVRRAEQPWATDQTTGVASLKAVAAVSSTGVTSSTSTGGKTVLSQTTQRSSSGTPGTSATSSRLQSPFTTAPISSASTSTAIRDPREAQWSSLSAGNAATLSTFCSCMGPPKTVPRIRTSTSTTSNPPTANPSTPTTGPPLTTSTSMSSSSSTVSTPVLGPPLTISSSSTSTPVLGPPLTISTSTSTSRSSSSSSASPSATCGTMQCDAPSNKNPRGVRDCTNPSCSLCEERYMQSSSEKSKCVSCVKEWSYCNIDADCCGAGRTHYCQQYSQAFRLCRKMETPCGTLCATPTTSGRAALFLWAA